MPDDFFTYKTLSHNDNELDCEVEINPKHEIFKGHFPGQPIVPGVCMVSIVETIFKEHINNDINLSKAKSIKFLSFIDPSEVTQVKASIKWSFQNNEYKVVASFSSDEKSYFKFNGHFIPGE
jgi:3-hydroxyacyl-[acyl-carrier-protein] dehydratase